MRDEASALWQLSDRQTLTGKRNRAILAILLGCGLRRRELAELTTGKHSEAGGALGHSRSCGQGQAHPNRS